MRLFSPRLKNEKNPPQENFLYSKKWNFLTLILKESFSYISGNVNPQKIPYISGNGTFLYSRKRKPQKKSYISESNFPSSKSVLYFRRNFQSPKSQNLLYFSQKSYE